jgi:outer membrane protein assembly factor BamB/Icc-related predicted phosphoesterase
MKKIISVITIILLTSILNLAQPFKFAWISDLHIGILKADEDLKTIVEDINKRTELDFVIITGDITEKGSNEELDLAKKILDKLKVHYYLVPGSNDTRWSESACTKFKELWKDDKFVFEYKGTKFIGLCSSIPWTGGVGHISPEDLTWLNDVLIKTNPQQEIIYLQYNLLNSETDNWFDVINKLRSYNVQAILVGSGYENKLFNFSGIAGAIGRSSLNRREGWIYTEVEYRKDTIAFYEINKDSIPELWGYISKIKKETVPKIDSLQLINYNTNLLWRKDLNKTFIASPLIWKNKIYTASRSGIISCFDSTGKIIWEYESFAEIFSCPVIADNILAAGDVRGDLITLNPNSGTQIQTLGLDDIITSQLITANYKGDKLLMSGQKPDIVIIIGTSSGRLLCYDLNSLEPVWENNSAKGMIETKPLVIENKIIYGSWDGYLYCVDARTGVMIWRWTENKDFYNSPALCQPVSDGNNVYITAPDKSVTAIDLLLGRTVWRKECSADESIGISADNKNLLIKTTKDKFLIISAKNGKIIKEIGLKFGDDNTTGNLTEINGNIVFATQNGSVFLIDKNYGYKQLLFLGTCRIHSIQNVYGNIFVALNMDGKISIFELK